ncbi:MAG: hypothetical protein QOH89_880 [Pseudonocardiales bacterium]|nr:hypothetical protein [Pseudonocardiales bacterium]MDT4940450.1 hypothetical protein [Pseudonocardiales bacterium]
MSPSAPLLIDMPGWRPIMRQVLTRTALVSLLPMAVFYTTLSLFGVRTAAIVTAGLYYAALLSRIIRRQPVLAAALFAAGLLSLRTAIVFLTGSAFLYFLQPVAGTVAVATAFAATMLAGRPVLERFAHEFCPIAPELTEQLRSTQFFNWLSLVWTLTYGINAVGTVWLLTTSSLHGFIMMKAFLGPLLTCTAALITYLVFRATIRSRNVRIRWAHHQGWSPARA